MGLVNKSILGKLGITSADVQTLINNSAWLQATDQTLLTGDKSGSFDLTTSGTLTGGTLKANDGSDLVVTGTGIDASGGGRGYINVYNPYGDGAGSGFTFWSWRPSVSAYTFGLFQLDSDGNMVFRIPAAANKVASMYFDSADTGNFYFRGLSSVTHLTITDTGSTIAGNNANAVFAGLTLTNNVTPTTGQVAQTSDIVFNLTQSINAVASLHEAARISAYKVSDWFHASDESDTDSGLKFWTTNAGTSAARMTIDNAGLVSVGITTGSYAFNVINTQNNNTIAVTDTTTGGIFFFDINDARGQMGTKNNFPYTFNVNNTSAWTMDTDFGFKSGTDGTAAYDITTAGVGTFGASAGYGYTVYLTSDAQVCAGKFTISGLAVEILGANGTVYDGYNKLDSTAGIKFYSQLQGSSNFIYIDDLTQQGKFSNPDSTALGQNAGLTVGCYAGGNIYVPLSMSSLEAANIYISMNDATGNYTFFGHRDSGIGFLQAQLGQVRIEGYGGGLGALIAQAGWFGGQLTDSGSGRPLQVTGGFETDSTLINSDGSGTLTVVGLSVTGGAITQNYNGAVYNKHNSQDPTSYSFTAHMNDEGGAGYCYIQKGIYGQSYAGNLGATTIPMAGLARINYDSTQAYPSPGGGGFCIDTWAYSPIYLGTATQYQDYTIKIDIDKTVYFMGDIDLAVSQQYKINAVNALFNGLGAGTWFIGGAGSLAVGAVGTNNMGMGGSALAQLGNGASNVAVGAYALYTTSTGGDNVGIGHTTGYYNNGSKNIFIGTSAGGTGVGGATSLDNSIHIGYKAGTYETADNKLFIDSIDRTTEAAGRTNSLIYGIFNSTVASQSLTVNAGGINLFGDVTLGATTGVKLTAAAGVLTIAGVGNTNNENLTLDFETTANVCSLGSGTGLTNITIPSVWFLNFGGTSNYARFSYQTQGNDNFQLGLICGATSSSGYFNIMEKADMGNANRSPLATSVDPVLRIYSSDATQALDYLEFYHNQTDAVIDWGNGNLRIGTADSKNLILGAGSDMSVQYTGTVGRIDTSLVAPSDLQIDCGTAMTLVLDVGVYEDLQFAVSNARVPAANYPDWETFTTNTAEYSFAVDDYIDCQANEVPHSWQEGTAGDAHLHLALKAAQSDGADRFAKFSLYFALSDPSQAGTKVWSELATATAEITIPTGTAALTGLYLDMGDLTLTGYKVGTQIRVRIKRIAATGGTEYNSHIFITQCGVHLKRDTMGSRAETTK